MCAPLRQSRVRVPSKIVLCGNGIIRRPDEHLALATMLIYTMEQKQVVKQLELLKILRICTEACPSGSQQQARCVRENSSRHLHHLALCEEIMHPIDPLIDL